MRLSLLSWLDELEKIAERKKPVHERAVDVGAPMLAGAGVGRTLSDLSLSATHGASPRRKTIGTLIGAIGGLGYRAAEDSKDARRKAYRASQKEKKAAPQLSFGGTATSSFLKKPGKTISSMAPKIGRLGSLPKIG